MYSYQHRESRTCDFSMGIFVYKDLIAWKTLSRCMGPQMCMHVAAVKDTCIYNKGLNEYDDAYADHGNDGDESDDDGGDAFRESDDETNVVEDE